MIVNVGRKDWTIKLYVRFRCKDSVLADIFFFWNLIWCKIRIGDAMQIDTNVNINNNEKQAKSID